MKLEDIQRVAIVGAGLMGHGMALEFALAGYGVRLHSRTPESVAKGLAELRASAARMERLGLVEAAAGEAAVERVSGEPDLARAVGDCDVVMETVYEDLELKRRLFAELDRHAPPHAILASNTSTLRMSEFTAGIGRPDKVVMAHYFNPPHLVPLVEVVACPTTSEETMATTVGLLAHIGKQPVRVEREVPGFIANRLQAALFREALSLVEQGVATAQDVDTVVTASIGRRWAVAGPFEVWEHAGWDLVLAGGRGLNPTLNASPDPSPVLEQKVERRELGVKTGKGFYDWTPEMVEASRNKIAAALVAIAKWGGA